MVKRSPPRLLLWLAWICALLRVLSDGGGCGDVAAGWPAVVVVGVVGGVVVVAGGVSGGASGVCDDAIPAKQSSTSAELLNSSKRLLRIDITRPHS